MRVVAVADLLEEPRQRYMREFDIPRGYASHTELLQDDDIDAVAVVLGHQLHHRLTVDALNAGKHVLVEKPMALSLEHCDAMIAAADANHRKLMVGLTQHFYPTSITAKSILDSGTLGPLSRPCATCPRTGTTRVGGRSTAAAITAAACCWPTACTSSTG